MHRTGPNHWLNPTPAWAAAGTNLLVSYRNRDSRRLRLAAYIILNWSRDALARPSTQEVGCVGSGAHVSVMAMVDNARGIRKAK